MNRIEKLRELIREKNLEGCLVAKPENIYYFANVFPHEPSFLVVPKEKEAKLVIAPSAYRDAEERASVEVVKGRLDIYEAGKEVLQSCGCIPRESMVPVKNFFGQIMKKKIGVEGDFLGIGVLRGVGIRKYEDVSPFIMAMRSIKEEGEISLLKKAVEVAEKAMEETFGEIGSGKSEREISGYFDYAAKRLGADETKARVRFDINSSKPFSRDMNLVLEEGPLLIDYGARIEGYWSDLTRMFYLGNPTEQFERAYSAVCEAQDAALDAARAGSAVANVDLAVREVLKKYGYEKNFVYTPGHGIGLEVHELPIISSQPARRIEVPEFSSASSEMKSLIRTLYKMAENEGRETLKEKMVITLEPGVYFENFGVRLEDMVLVDKKTERLSRFPRELDSVVKNAEI